MILVWMVALPGCQEDYLVDGGKSSPYYDGTIMEYLEASPEIFGDLVKVIKLTSWERVFSDENDELTFFAPTDFSIERSMEFMNQYMYVYEGLERVTDLEQIKPEVWESLLGMYVMKGKYRLNDIVQIDTAALSAYPGQTNRTYDRNYKMTMGVYHEDASGIKYAGYRRVMYAYPEAGRPVYAYVSTCNIEPTNGIIHVIRLDHHFGFTTTMLHDRAIEAGVLYP
jgi:hypothetical protein